MTWDEKLRARMAENGWKTSDLLRKFEAHGGTITHTSLQHWVDGKVSPPRLQKLVVLAKATGLSLDYLADDMMTEPGPERGIILSPDEEKALDMVRHIGAAQAMRVLTWCADLGFREAMARLMMKRDCEAL